jgi:DNA-directed RNA polymerase subunit RPC12/RpoP
LVYYVRCVNCGHEIPLSGSGVYDAPVDPLSLDGTILPCAKCGKDTKIDHKMIYFKERGSGPKWVKGKGYVQE